LTTLTYSHTHHVACHSPKVSSNGSSDPPWYLPSPSRGQQPSFAPPSPTNPHAPNCSPSLPSAAPRCTIPAFLHHPVHSHRPSILSRHSSTFPTFMPYLPPAPYFTLSLPSTATFHLLVSLNVLTTTTLLRLRRILLTGIKYILLLRSTMLVLLQLFANMMTVDTFWERRSPTRLRTENEDSSSGDSHRGLDKAWYKLQPPFVYLPAHMLFVSEFYSRTRRENPTTVMARTMKTSFLRETPTRSSSR
jgi:hypothetical protein